MTSTEKEENCWHSGRGKPQSHLDAQMSQHRCVLEAPYLNLPENVLRMCSMCTLITLKSTSFGIYVTLYVIFPLLGLSYTKVWKLHFQDMIYNISCGLSSCCC